MIVLIIGPMFSGKSTYILNEERKAIISKKKSICVKHSIDTRYSNDSNIINHNNRNNNQYNNEIFPMCSFGHLIGYDVGYYSYLWSIIYSYDIFSKFQRNGLFSNKIGMELRRKIMEKGASKSGVELLKDFLKRNPSEKYFIKNIF